MDYQNYFQYIRKLCTKINKLTIHQLQSKVKKHFHANEREVKKILQYFIEQGILQIILDEVNINFLANTYRRKIYSLIENYPGLNINTLKKKLRIGTSQLLWHLNVLESIKLIKPVSFGKIKAYGLTDIEDKIIILGCIYYKNSIRDLIKFLINYPHGQTELDIVTHFSRSRSSVNYTLNILKKMNIIQVEKSERNLYSINKKLIIHFDNLNQKFESLQKWY